MQTLYEIVHNSMVVAPITLQQLPSNSPLNFYQAIYDSRDTWQEFWNTMQLTAVHHFRTSKPL